MRIAINLIGYEPGVGGVETYVTNLLSALQNIDHVNQYLILCDAPAVPSLNINSSNFNLRSYSYHKYSIRGVLRGITKRFCSYDILCQELSNLPIDVMHHPLTVLNPPGLAYRSVLTFHDMQHVFYPDFFSKRELLARKKSYLSSVSESDSVITVSEHAGANLVEKYGIDAAKIHVVHSGCGDDFHRRDLSTLEAVASKYSVKEPFLFYPASLWPHKNHVRLLKALKILIDREQFDGFLLLTGAPLNAERRLIEEVENHGLTSRVRWLGYVPKNDMPFLYNLARIMVFPSLFEGFGLPVLEAMASGCPVICSRNTSLPEVGGEAVDYFDPLVIDDIAETICRVWHDDVAISNMQTNGIIQAAKFSWKETAKKTAEVYRLTGMSK